MAWLRSILTERKPCFLWETRRVPRASDGWARRAILPMQRTRDILSKTQTVPWERPSQIPVSKDREQSSQAGRRSLLTLSVSSHHCASGGRWPSSRGVNSHRYQNGCPDPIPPGHTGFMHWDTVPVRESHLETSPSSPGEEEL